MRGDWLDWMEECETAPVEASLLAMTQPAGFVQDAFSDQGHFDGEARAQRRDLLHRLAHSDAAVDQALYRMIN